jgi:hypothetical protein
VKQSYRLNISIPFDIYRRLDQHRDRFNVSRVCADAIERKIVELEEADGKAQDIAATIAQLRAEIAMLKGYR